MIRENEGRPQKPKDRDLERRRTKNQREWEIGGAGNNRYPEVDRDPERQKDNQKHREIQGGVAGGGAQKSLPRPPETPSPLFT